MKNNTKDLITGSAIKVFADKGFDAASMREIAEKAGVTKPMIYYYFKNKEDLYLYLLDGDLSKLNQETVAVLALPISSCEKLQLFVKRFVTHLRKNQDTSEFVVREIIRGHKTANELTDKYFSKMYSALVEVIDEGIEDGSFKTLDPQATAISVIGIINDFFSERKIFERMVGGKARLNELFDSLHIHILDLLKR